MTARAHVASYQPESVIRAAAEQPWRRWGGSCDPNDLFYLGPPKRTPDRKAAASDREDHQDARLITRLEYWKRCPRRDCGSSRISWHLGDDGRYLGKCWACGAYGTVDSLLQHGPRVSPILFAIKSATRRVAYGILPRRGLPIPNHIRRAAKTNAVLADGLERLTDYWSARCEVLERYGDAAALEADLFPLTLGFWRFLPGRRRIGRHAARKQLAALIEYGLLTPAPEADSRYPMFRFAHRWNQRRAALSARRALRGRKVLSVPPPVCPGVLSAPVDALVCSLALSEADAPARDGPPGDLEHPHQPMKEAACPLTTA